MGKTTTPTASRISRIVTQIATLDSEEKRRQIDLESCEQVADRFNEIATVLMTTDFEQILMVATEPECRISVEDLIASVCVYPDEITIQVAGAVLGYFVAARRRRGPPMTWSSDSLLS
jgi:hypothetical protein